MSKDYIVRNTVDYINGKEVEVIPESIIEAIKVFYGSTTTLKDVLDEITPVIMTREEYKAKVESGEIDDDDETFYYVPEDSDYVFSISDSTVTKYTTFSSQRLAECFASLGVNIVQGDVTGMSKIFNRKVVTKTVTLGSGGWYGKTYVLDLDGMTTDTVIQVRISESLTDSEYLAQYTAYKKSDFMRVKRQTDKLIFVTLNDVPTIDITLDIDIF